MRFLLVFEDHPIVGVTLRETMEQSGYRVVVTSDYAYALRILNREVPDAIVVDLTQTVAWWLLDDVRANERLAEVPVVVTVDRLDERLWGRAQLALRKPYRLDDLMLAVRAFAPFVPTIERRRRSVPVPFERRRSAA